MAELIRVEGLPELLKRITDLQQLRPVKLAVRTAALHVKGKVAVYPQQRRMTRASVYGSTFVSDKQRRYFFAALKRGEIEVPYRRGESPKSETLGRRWTVNITNNGMRAVIGNNASYGPLVMDQDRQSVFMKAVGWRTVQEIVEDERATVMEVIRRGITETLMK